MGKYPLCYVTVPRTCAAHYSLHCSSLVVSPIYLGSFKVTPTRNYIGDYRQTSKSLPLEALNPQED